MTKGAVLFAFNNDKVDYVSQAQWSAPRIERHLGLPTTLVTNDPPEDTSMFDNVVVTESKSGGTRKYDHMNADSSAHWYNCGRHNAYAFSPYDETLVLDTDYIVASDRLKVLFDVGQDLLCHRYVLDVTDRENFAIDTRFGFVEFPMWWATVLYFKRSRLAEDTFAMMNMIENNYYHYSRLYKFKEEPYRNDYAISIALSTLYGHLPNAVPSIPWPLLTSFYDVYLNQLDDDQFQLNYVRMVEFKERHQRMILSNTDLHVMNKPDFGKICGSRI
jgi:hypothetical protein